MYALLTPFNIYVRIVNIGKSDEKGRKITFCKYNFGKISTMVLDTRHFEPKFTVEFNEAAFINDAVERYSFNRMSVGDEVVIFTDEPTPGIPAIIEDSRDNIKILEEYNEYMKNLNFSLFGIFGKDGYTDEEAIEAEDGVQEAIAKINHIEYAKLMKKNISLMVMGVVSLNTLTVPIGGVMPKSIVDRDSEYGNDDDEEYEDGPEDEGSDEDSDEDSDEGYAN